MKQYKALLVGNGTMGKRHRERFEACGVQFVAVADNYSEFNGVANKLNLYNAGAKARIRDIDFVVVASPATTHYAYAKFFLERGVPVFVEKPLAITGSDAQELVDMASRDGIALFVAQSECYNPVFLNFRKHFAAEMNKQCGGDVRLEFRREHKYSERCRDVNVALDLLVHDLSLFFTMFRAQDVKVQRFQISNSDCDNRTIAVDFGRDETSPESRYTVSLARYTQEGEIEHIPDSLENEHRFFLKLLAGACGEWGLRAAQNAADCVKFATHQ